MKNKKLLAKCILTPLISGSVIGYLASSSGAYGEMIKPPLSPPPSLFPIVWTILYVLMGISLYLVLMSDADAEQKSKAKTVFASQLVLNLLWPIIFFTFRAYYAAALCLVFLIGFIIKTYLEFKKSDTTAANLLIPYIIWCLFALYLNIGIAILN